MKRIAFLTALSVCLGTALAQSYDRRATMTGSRGDHGKCTIEVEVDGAAEVEIRGADARIRTLFGTPSTWRRFECSDPLPRNPADFRFRGIDGRGSQNLLRDPRNNRGIAVIRIDDPKGGREGYTFDIEWSGNAGGGNDRGGWDNDRRRDQRDWNDDRRGGNDRGRRMRDAIETCKNAVKAKANSEYGVERVSFNRAEVDDNPGRRDWINGTFSGQSRGRRGDFSFTCSVDLSSGEVRKVNVVPLNR